MQLPDKNCPLCPRLCAFHGINRERYPSYHNAPVPSFGELDAELLIVGLAPGLHGANQTGRPFTGDYAGIVLYSSLLKHGFAHNPREGWDPLYIAKWGEDVDSRLRGNLEIINTRITNAVRCVPPDNKPEPSEIKTCGQFLVSEIKSMPNLKAILSLGLVSHNAVLKALGLKAGDYKFAHGAVHYVGGVKLYNSYHCSRYNINTKRLTQAMFDEVIREISSFCGTR